MLEFVLAGGGNVIKVTFSGTLLFVSMGQLEIFSRYTRPGVKKTLEFISVETRNRAR